MGKTFTGFEKLNGNTIRIDHGMINGVKVLSTFIHLDSYCVKQGEKIKQGQQIGTVGSTGHSTGPHLHLTIKENDVPVNPKLYVGDF